MKDEDVVPEGSWVVWEDEGPLTSLKALTIFAQGVLLPNRTEDVAASARS